MLVTLLAFAIGLVAGLRAMTAIAAAGWALHLGLIDPGGSWLGYLGHGWVPWVLTLLALGELVTDQLPATPSRTVPVQFGARLLSGALSGATVGLATGSPIGGTVAGVLGAAAGTLGGSRGRAWLAGAFGRDRPAAFIEDAVAIAGAALIVGALP
jgi:uncharacterized membrane protein